MHLRRITSSFAMVAGLAIPIAASAVLSEPIAVSPGAADGLEEVPTRCPSYSWTILPDAEGYEIVVVEIVERGSTAANLGVDPAEEEGAVVLRQTLPRGASHWSPSVDDCLPTGRHFAWTVRARGELGWMDWSEPLLFATPGRIVTRRPEPFPTSPIALEPIAIPKEAISGPGISSGGMIESTSGGFKFPDGSVQTKAFRMRVFHAVVDSDGTKRSGNVASVTRTNTGAYEIDLGRSLVLCSVTVTPGTYDPEGSVVILFNGFATTYVQSSSNVFTVRTWFHDGSAADMPFALQVVCSPFSIF